MTNSNPWNMTVDGMFTSFMSKAEIQAFGYNSQKTIGSWYEEDSTKNHLGLIKILNQRETSRFPLYEEFFKNKAVIEVDTPNTRITYDVEVEQNVEVKVTVSTDHLYTYPGLDGGVFKLILDTKYSPGDSLSPAGYIQHAVMVMEGYEVKKEGSNYVHMVRYLGTNSKSYLPPRFLKAGVIYSRSGQSVGGEHGRNYAAPMASTKRSTVRMAFFLGNHMGVESTVTMYANKMIERGVSSVDVNSKLREFERQISDIGTDEMGNKRLWFVIGDPEKTDSGKYKLDSAGRAVVDRGTTRIGHVMEYLVLAELRRIEAIQLLFHPGGEVADQHGVRKINPGVFHQLNRATKIQYDRPGGLTFGRLCSILDTAYRKAKRVPPSQRVITIKAGSVLYKNIAQILNTQAELRGNRYSMLTGTQSLLPKPLVTGADLTKLHMKEAAFASLEIPGRGTVIIQKEDSFDMVDMSSYNSDELVGRGFSSMACNGIVVPGANARAAKTSWKLGDGARVTETEKEKESDLADLYYVKLKGPSLFWGYERGRYDAFSNTGGPIEASHRGLASTTFAHTASAALIPDPSRFLLIECTFESVNQ